MVRETTGSFRDIIIHPGETLKEALEDRAMTQKQLAQSIGMTEQHISRIIKGKTNISGRCAKKLEYALGIPASFWMNLQRNYDLELAEYQDRNNISDEEYTIFEKIRDIMAEILSLKGESLEGDKTFGVIQARRTFRLSSLLHIPDVMPDALYRKSKTANIDEYVTFAWLRLCDCHLEGIPKPEAGDPATLLEHIEDIKGLMFGDDIYKTLRSLQSLLRSIGIRFAVVRHFPGAPIHGMTRKNPDGTLDLCLTVRGSRADIFWFSLFHEFAHIILEDFDDIGSSYSKESEQIADRQAASLLISDELYTEFVKKRDFSYNSIAALAESSNVPEYIIIGRLQNDGYLPWQHSYNRYVPMYKWQ